MSTPQKIETPQPDLGTHAVPQKKPYVKPVLVPIGGVPYLTDALSGPNPDASLGSHIFGGS